MSIFINVDIWFRGIYGVQAEYKMIYGYLYLFLSGLICLLVYCLMTFKMTIESIWIIGAGKFFFRFKICLKRNLTFYR